MQQKAEKILTDMIKISSYGIIGKDHPIVKYFKNSFYDCVDSCLIEDNNGNVHMLIGLNTQLSNVKNCTILSGHIDTVSSKPENFFADRDFDDGKIRGRGASDMKGFWASIIANKEELKNCTTPIVLAITSDEETELNGINVLLAEIDKRNINPSLVIVGEPTSSTFSLSNRGNSIFVNNFKGVAAHTSTPEKGTNAILMANKMIGEISKISSQYVDDAVFCITGIDSRAEPSVVPCECKLKFGVRANNEQIVDRIVDDLQNATNEISLPDEKSTLIKVFEIPPFCKQASAEILEVAKQDGIGFSCAEFTTEAGFFQKSFPNSDIVIYGPGNPACIHKDDEFIEREKLESFGGTLVNVVENYHQLTQENLLEEN